MKKPQVIGLGAAIIIGFAYVGAKMYASSIAEEKIDMAIANLVNYVDVDYRNVSVDLLGFDVHVSDIVISPVSSEEKINIDEIVVFDISNLYYGNKIHPGSFVAVDDDLTGSRGYVKLTFKDNKRGGLYRGDCLTKQAQWANCGSIF